MPKDLCEKSFLCKLFAHYFVSLHPFSKQIADLMGEQTNDIAQELALLHTLSGADYARQVERIAQRKEFRPVIGEPAVFTVGGEKGEDYDNLQCAAQRAVEHGHRVFILPNPKGTRSADLILEKKGVFKLYDVKTIQGKSSVGTRLQDSIGQANRVLLNMRADYNARLLASDIKAYFESNSYALEILIFKGHKAIIVNRRLTQNDMFNRLFRKMYEK